MSLYIDGIQYEGSITEGDLYWHVNTGAFSNGMHTLQVLAVDNAGNPALGGSSGSSVGGNETFSSPITLTFTNIVRWIEPVAGFSDFVPISIRSDVYPTNWTVYVEDESGAIVRTFSGTTSDGIIETEWDGADDNGNQVPALHGYQVLFVLGELPPPEGLSGGATNSSPPPGPMNSSSGTQESATEVSDQESFIIGSSYNVYGSLDYQIATPLPPIPAFFLDPEIQRKVEKGEWPPLPPLLPWTFSEDPEHPTYRKSKVSVLGAANLRAKSTPSRSEKSTAQNVESMAAASGGTGLVTGTNSIIVWREAPWNSGEIVLTRQKFNGGITVQALNTAFASDLNTLKSDVTTAHESDERLQYRTVYSGAISVMDVNADFDTLLNDLKQPPVTDFYYIGHSNGNGIGYSENAQTNGITTRRLSLALGNVSVRSSRRWGGRWLFIVNTPFRFVFIDGCLSAKGPFHEAFGIIEDSNATRVGKHVRAYLGWNTKTKNSMLNTSQQRWSAKFWKHWIDNDADPANYDKPLDLAILQASADQSIPEQPVIIGYRRLRWSD